VSINKKAITTYAKSLFQSVNSLKPSEGVFEVSKITSSSLNDFVPNVYIIGEELDLIRSILTSSTKMTKFFENPTYRETQKLDVILSIFPGLTTTTKSFLKVLTERSHLALIPHITEEYTGYLLKFKKTAFVKLSVASTLKEKSGELLLKTLKKLTNSNEVVLNISYNPKLLGGLILEYNSFVIDASILKEFSLLFKDI
jgi:ATP synthase F1 delta subunit